MRVSVGLPIWGRSMESPGLDTMLEVSCQEAVDGIWVGDHVVLASLGTSKYPYSSDGRFFLSPDDAWYEAFVCLGYIAGRVGAVELGTAVALAALRPPALLAKQAATIARLARGGFALGVGTGWLRAEYEAVGVPFRGRGQRVEDAVRVMREYWTGQPRPGRYGIFAVPEGIGSYPTPPSPVPILFGGNSGSALSRAARLGDGWLAAVGPWRDSTEEVSQYVRRFFELWRRHRGANAARPIVGAVQAAPRAVTRSANFGERIRSKLADYARLGLSNVIFNLNWDDISHVRETIKTIKKARDSVVSELTKE